MNQVVRGIVFGAAVGAAIGLVAGLVLHAIVGDGSLVIYEMVGGPLGAIFGAGLGAFYGGASRLPRDPR